MEKINPQLLSVPYRGNNPNNIKCIIWKKKTNIAKCTVEVEQPK